MSNQQTAFKNILNGSISLTKLKHVVKKFKKQNGELVDALVIPIELNYLEQKEGAVYLPLRVMYRHEPDQFGQDGFISQSIGSELWKTLSDEQKEIVKNEMQILGNIKDFERSRTANDNSGAMNESFAEVQSNEADDDLPF